MKNRNVQIPYELFYQLLQYFLMENYEGEDSIRKGLEKKLNAMVDRELYSTNRRRKRRVPAGIPGKKGNTGKFSMVGILIDYFGTGACHAPVCSRQGKSR